MLSHSSERENRCSREAPDGATLFTARKQLKVGYDAHAFTRADGGTGKGHHLKTLIDYGGAEFVGFAPRGLAIFDDRVHVIQGGTGHYLVWQQLELPRLVRRSSPDVFLAPYNTVPIGICCNTTVVLVLHDLILLDRNRSYSWKLQLVGFYKRWLLRRSVRVTSRILTVSEFSRRQILREFPGSRVSVIPCTLDADWFVDSALPFASRGNYLLLVTGIPAHKNALAALRAYAKYRTMARQNAAELRVLGLSSARSHYEKVAAELEIERYVTFENFLSPSEMKIIFRRAAAVMVPSLMEGFGIPALEAMASGTPVILSRAGSLPEIGSSAARYFDAHDISDMAQTIYSVLGDPQLQERMARDGSERAAQFAPDIVGRRVSEFWSEIAESKGRCVVDRRQYR